MASRERGEENIFMTWVLIKDRDVLAFLSFYNLELEQNIKLYHWISKNYFFYTFPDFVLPSLLSLQQSVKDSQKQFSDVKLITIDDMESVTTLCKHTTLK